MSEQAVTEQAAFPIQFTDAAAARVKELVAEEENPALMLRVYVTGGGCSGFSYGFTFDELAADDDTFIEKDSSINAEVERLRHSTTNSLLSRRDVVVVSSAMASLTCRARCRGSSP